MKLCNPRLRCYRVRLEGQKVDHKAAVPAWHHGQATPAAVAARIETENAPFLAAQAAEEEVRKARFAS